MNNLLVVRKRIKKVTGLRMSEGFPQDLSKKVEQLIKKATTRAKANRRKTLRSKDL